jgi:hypothetical protein
MLAKREQHGERDIVSHKIISWWKYNPLLQKPTSLNPVVPWGWYWYYGPDPASGCSYGQYHDDEYDFDMITAKDQIVYSPATGKPMQFVDMVPKEEFDEKLSKVTGKQFAGCKATCTSCKAESVSDYDLSELDEVHCVKCGDECEISTMDKNTIKGAKTMTKENATEQRVQNLKRRIRANILKKRKSEAANEKRVQLEDELRKKRALANKLRNNKKIKAEEEAKKEDDEDELISLDTIMEAMEDEEAPAEELSDESLLEGEEEEVCEDDEICAEDESAEPAEDEELDFSDESEEAPELELDVEDNGEEVELDVDLEGGEPNADSDEYYDLDMVLSMINKKAKAAKAKPKAKAKVKAKKKVKAEEELADKVEEEAVDDEAALENEEKDKENEKEVSLLDESCDGEPCDKEEPVAPKEELEAMKFEPLAALAHLKDLRKEDIDMTLYNEESANPTWNVTVAGIPTARIELRKQSAADEIRAVFCSEDYAKDLMVHCEKTGFIQTMNKVKAEFWSNYTSNKKIANRFKQEAKASFENDRKRLLASYRQEYRNCINIVSAGMSKNFYPDMGNALKENLFANLRTVGLPEQTAISVVEKSFAEGSAQYFEALFEKAEEYMNLTPDSRKEIAAAISHGSHLEHTASLHEVAPATLGDRVAQASTIANTFNGAPSMRVSNDVVLDSNAYKAQLRSVWRNR